MSASEINMDSSDEDLLRLQRGIAEEEAEERAERAKRRGRADSTTSATSATSATSETSADGSGSSTSTIEESTDLELALALKKLHDKELRRIRQMVVSLRECRKKLIEFLIEKKKMEKAEEKQKDTTE